MVSQSGSTTNQQGQTSTSTITNAFIWCDRALQQTISNAQSSGTTTSSFTYNANNYLTYVSTTGAQAKQISYTTDAVGQIMVRTQTTNGSSTSPKDFAFYFGGVKIGAIGNNGTDNVDYSTAITWNGSTDGTGPFREGAAAGSSYADFDQNWTAIDPAAGLEGADSSYTVSAGQTLSSIAQALWGDASLWYMLAQANGLTADDAVAAGQVLTVPSKVSNFHNSASTFKPYDAAKAIGDVAPGAPKPKGNKCGVFGQILLAVIAIAVTLAYAPYIGTVPAAMLASAVSQGVGVATGIQDKFSFKQVAMAGVTALATAGVSKVLGNGLMFGSQFIGDVVRGAASSALSQGIGVATGLQDKFSWSGVAAAGIANGVSAGVTRQLTKSGGPFASGFGTKAASGGAALLANAATRSIIDGTDFGDSIIAALPDTIAQLLVDGVSTTMRKKSGLEGLSKDQIAKLRDQIHGALRDADVSARYTGKPPAAITALDGLELTTNDGLADAIKELAEFPTVQLAMQAASLKLGVVPAAKTQHGVNSNEADSQAADGEIVVVGSRKEKARQEFSLTGAITINYMGNVGTGQTGASNSTYTASDQVLHQTTVPGYWDIRSTDPKVRALVLKPVFGEDGKVVETEIFDAGPGKRYLGSKWPDQYDYFSIDDGNITATFHPSNTGSEEGKSSVDRMADGIISTSLTSTRAQMAFIDAVFSYSGKYIDNTKLGSNASFDFVQSGKLGESATWGWIGQGAAQRLSGLSLSAMDGVGKSSGISIPVSGLYSAVVYKLTGVDLNHLYPATSKNQLIGQALGGLAVDETTIVAGGARISVSRGAAAESGSAKFVSQGFSPAQAEYLAEPYPATDMGHHFIPRNGKISLPSSINDSPFNVLRPNGISRGDFYELHYRVDPSYPGSRLPADVGGGGWYGRSLGLEKYGTVGRIWYGSPAPLKVTVGVAAAATGGAIYWSTKDGK